MASLFHGTNKQIIAGLAEGTYFTNDISIALFYAKQKDGNRIYVFTASDLLISDLFSRDDFDEHWVSRCFLPLENLMSLVAERGGE